jgi:hypothetical protein
LVVGLPNVSNGVCFSCVVADSELR